jgi:hypothetical protein
MNKKQRALQPHGELTQLARNLWYVEGSIHMPLGDLKRNMIVYRLPSGELLLHSVVAMDEASMQALEALGRPAYLIVPHGSHRLDAAFYKDRYPAIRVLAPAAARAKVEEVVNIDATEEETLPGLGIGVVKIDGMKNDKGENALLVDVDGGKALILNDVIWTRGFSGNPLIRLLGTQGGALGVARAVRWSGVKDRAAVKATLDRLADIPQLELMTVSHGSPVRGRVSERLRAAAAQL